METCTRVLIRQAQRRCCLKTNAVKVSLVCNVTSASRAFYNLNRPHPTSTHHLTTLTLAKLSKFINLLHSSTIPSFQERMEALNAQQEKDAHLFHQLCIKKAGLEAAFAEYTGKPVPRIVSNTLHFVAKHPEVYNVSGFTHASSTGANWYSTSTGPGSRKRRWKPALAKT